jgi:hypothetical protein
MRHNDLVDVLYMLKPNRYECPQIFIDKGVGTQPSLVEPTLLYFLRKDEVEDLIKRVIDFRGSLVNGDSDDDFYDSYSGTRVRPISVYVKVRRLLKKSAPQEDGRYDWPWLSDKQLNLIMHPKLI